MSGNADSSKILAAIGALMLFLSFMPVIGLIGIILFFIGMKGLSDYYRDSSIYQHALKALIFGIIGIVAISALALMSLLGLGLSALVADGIGAILGGILFIILMLIVGFIFYLLMAINLRRAFDTLATCSGENNFHTAGTLLFWGAILTIIVVGLFLIWLAWLIAAIAFFSMRLTPTQPTTYSPPPPPTTTATAQGTRFCPNCGAPVDASATFCPHCGKQLSQT